MITQPQLTEIRKYLLSRNLPVDLLMEVEDHFISHINELITHENTDFKSAFEKVKSSWYADLSFSKYKIQFDLNNVTYFEKKVKNAYQRDIMNKAGLTLAIMIFLIFFAAISMNSGQFYYVFTALTVLAVLVPAVQYIRYHSVFKLRNKYSNLKLTWSQNYTGLSVTFAGAMIPFLYNHQYYAKSTFALFQHFSADLNLVSFILYIFVFGMNIYCFYAQRDYLIKMLKIKDFLPNLQPEI